MTRRIYTKICGLTRLADVRTCLEEHVDAIGFNLTADSPRRVDVEHARTLVHAARGAVIDVFWVVDSKPPEELAALVANTPRSFVQRCDPAWPWPQWLPNERRVDVVRLGAAEDVSAALKLSSGVLLSDATGTLGGSGKRADWALSKRLAEKRKLILAGGLTAENVADAIAATQPFGVDVASGVESKPGVKDPARVSAFVAAVRAAGQAGTRA